MINELCINILKKNKLGQEVSKKLNDSLLCKQYRQLKNDVTSAIRNTEIILYSNELETHKNDISKSWKILKTIIGKKINNYKQKLSFLIDDSTITDSQVIANEFNNFFVSIGRKLSEDIISTVSPLSFVIQVNNSIFIAEVSVTEVRTTILSLKTVPQVGTNFRRLLQKQVLIIISCL